MSSRGMAVVGSLLLCSGAIFTVATAPAAHAFEEPHVDFNGDGYADLVITAPGESLGSIPAAGAVTIMYGSSTGLQPGTSVTYTEDTPGIPEAAHARDFWGYTHAVGDFNGDGYDDLAVAGQDTVAAQDNAGTVTVLWGSAQGLTTSGAVLYIGSNTVAAASHAASWFGEGLAAGDFDGDHFADLTIGAPGVSHGALHTGIIVVLHGSHTGLVNTHTLIEQGSNGVPGARETNDWFGDTLFVTDLDHDAHDDLIVGDSNESAGSATYAGVVYRFWGSPTGLTSTGATYAVGSNPIANRFLGAWLAVTPNYENVYAWAPGDDTHASYVAQIQLDRSVAGAPAVVRRYTDPAPDMGLGAGMVGGHFSGGKSALVMGDPGYASGAGKIEMTDNVGHISSYAPGHYPMRWTSSPGANFGTQVTAEDFNHDGYDDLAVSAPYEDIGSAPQAGALYVMYGSYPGPQFTTSHHVTQETTGVPGASEPYDYWGWV